MNDIQALIEQSLADSREKVAALRAEQADVAEEGATDLRERLSKLAHVYDELAANPQAVEKWAMDEDPTTPYAGTKNEDVQPPTDGDRSTAETQLHVQVESSPHTKQEGTETEPGTNEESRDTLTTNDAPITAVTETPVGVPEKQAMVYATARIFQSAENGDVPNVSKIASDSGLSERVVNDLLTHIVTNKLAAEMPPEFAANVEKMKEKGEEKEEKKEEKAPASEEKEEEKEGPPPEVTGEKKAEASEGEAANTEAHDSPEQPEVFEAGERGPQSKEIPFLGTPEATTAFKKRQSKLVSNAALGGVLDTPAYKDPTLHQQFDNAEAAGVKTTP